MPTIHVGEQTGLFNCPGQRHTQEQVAGGRCTCRERDCGCTVPNNDVCTNCCQCHDCCECSVCPRCERRVSEGDFCGDCERCERCCRCGRREEEIPFTSGHLTFYPGAMNNPQKPGIPKAHELKENPLKRHVSVELEVDQYESYSGGALRVPVQRWHDAVVHDGSLSNGFEVNTNPSAGDFLVKHLKDYADAFQRMGPAKAGIDCGMHVHVNAKDFRQYDLRRLILLYRRGERALFDACQPRRLNTRYAQVCGQFYVTNDKKPKDFRGNLNYKLYGQQGASYVRPRPTTNYRERVDPATGRIVRTPIRRRPRPVQTRRDIVLPSRDMGSFLNGQKHEKYYSMRYKALNLHSWFYRGTIEFRHKEGLTKFDDMLGWSRVVGTFVDQALKLSEKDIAGLPTNSREALLNIMPQDLQSWLKDTWGRFDRAMNERQLAFKREIWTSQEAEPRTNPF